MPFFSGVSMKPTIIPNRNALIPNSHTAAVLSFRLSVKLPRQSHLQSHFFIKHLNTTIRANITIRPIVYKLLLFSDSSNAGKYLALEVLKGSAAAC